MGYRSFAYPGSDTYRPGGAWGICDVCSQRVRRTDLYVRWDNLRVDIKCLDPRPPQMSVPNVYPEGIPFPDARPPQDRPDRWTDDTALQSIVGGFQVQYGQTYPAGQVQQPGALSPLPWVETVGGIVTNDLLSTEAHTPISTEDNRDLLIEGTGTPQGPNVLADDVTLITGPIPAPDNTNSTVPDPVPAPRPTP